MDSAEVASKVFISGLHIKDYVSIILLMLRLSDQPVVLIHRTHRWNTWVGRVKKQDLLMSCASMMHTILYLTRCTGPLGGLYDVCSGTS